MILDDRIIGLKAERTLRASLDVSDGNCGSMQTTKMRRKELIERDADELMQEAASDELFLADLNGTMEDFGHADQEDHEFLSVDRLAG